MKNYLNSELYIMYMSALTWIILVIFATFAFYGIKEAYLNFKQGAQKKAKKFKERIYELCFLVVIFLVASYIVKWIIENYF